MHGAHAGITPGHTDYSQRGVWLAVGYASVFCILQRLGVARRVAASCAEFGSWDSTDCVARVSLLAGWLAG